MLPTGQTLHVVVSQSVPCAKRRGLLSVRIVEAALTLCAISVISSEAAQILALKALLVLLVLSLCKSSELPERTVRAILALSGRWCGGVEVRACLRLAEIRRVLPALLCLSLLGL